jgi:hypothetical protein
MKINEKQLNYLFKIKEEYDSFDNRYKIFEEHRNVVYFYQDEEHNDSAISMHIHWAHGVEVVSVDVYGDAVRKSWL